MSGVDAYTKLLLHCNGADAATTFTDETGKTMTAVGNAQIDTAQSKFGGAAGLFDGAGDYCTAVDSADWQLGTTFTIDFWFRTTDVTFFHGFCSQYQNSTNFWAFQFHGGIKKITFSHTVGNVETAGNLATWDPSPNTWYHVAVVAVAGVIEFYIGGVKLTKSTSNNLPSFTDFSAVFRVGAGCDSGEFSYMMKGWIDEFRVSKGIARWTANFTPPNAPYGTGNLLAMF